MKQYKHVPTKEELEQALPPVVEIYAENENELRNLTVDCSMQGPYSHKNDEYVGIHALARREDVVKDYAKSRGLSRAKRAYELGAISEDTYMRLID